MTRTLKILHTNDTHSYVETMAKRKHLFDTIRQNDPNVLTLDAGDNLTGSLFYTIFQGQYEPHYLNALHYDAITLGNHEFDGGSQVLHQFLTQLHCPVILSNVDFQCDDLLNQTAIIRDTITKTLPNGLKVGIFGLLTPSTKESSSPSAQTRFIDVVESAKRCIEQLKRDNVDIIVLLSHLGDEADVVLAQQLQDVSIIVGGHTHKKFEEPIVVTHGHKQTLIVQAGSYGKYVGELTLTIDSCRAYRWTYQLHALETYTHYDNALQLQLNALSASIKHVVEQPIAYTVNELVGKRDVTKKQSTNLTNLVTDAYFEKAKSLGFQPDIAIVNSGGIRQSIAQGVITYGHVMQLLPFACELVVCELTGQELFDALNGGEYPQVSHAKLTYVTINDKIQLQDVQLKGQNGFEPLQLDKTYVVVTNSFIASGKDGYVGFDNKTNAIQDNILDTTILADYFKQLHYPIHYTDEVRKEIV